MTALNKRARNIINDEGVQQAFERWGFLCKSDEQSIVIFGGRRHYSHSNKRWVSAVKRCAALRELDLVADLT